MKLLAIDMDGTCLNSKRVITKKTLQAIRSASEAGIIVVPTTGRTLTLLPGPLVRQGGYRYVICSNGAKIMDIRENRCIMDRQIQWLTASVLLEACAVPGLGLTAHIDDYYYSEGALLTLTGRIMNRKDIAYIKGVKDLAGFIREGRHSVEELQFFYFGKKEARAAVEREMKKFPDLSAAYDENYVEIYTAGTSKGTALRALGEHLGIAREDIACIGDNENDLPMFEAAGLRFAMGNAVPALKDRADVVLPGNDEDGVAAAINEYLLKN